MSGHISLRSTARALHRSGSHKAAMAMKAIKAFAVDKAQRSKKAGSSRRAPTSNRARIASLPPRLAPPLGGPPAIITYCRSHVYIKRSLTSHRVRLLTTKGTAATTVMIRKRLTIQRVRGLRIKQRSLTSHRVQLLLKKGMTATTSQVILTSTSKRA